MMNWDSETSQETHTVNKALKTNMASVVAKRKTSREQDIRERARICTSFRTAYKLITSKLLPAKYLPPSTER